MDTYTATATREGNWWVIIITAGEREIATQAKGLDRAEEIAREAISMALDIPEDSFAINLIPVIAPDLEQVIAQNVSLLTQLFHDGGLERLFLADARDLSLEFRHARSNIARTDAELVQSHIRHV